MHLFDRRRPNGMVVWKHTDSTYPVISSSGRTKKVIVPTRPTEDPEEGMASVFLLKADEI